MTIGDYSSGSLVFALCSLMRPVIVRMIVIESRLRVTGVSLIPQGV